MYLCLPSFQVTVHRISEILVMTENRTKALTSSDTFALKSQPCVEWDELSCAEEMKEPRAGGRSPPPRGSSLSSQGAVEEPGGSKCCRARLALLLPQQPAMSSPWASAAELIGLSSTVL